PGPSARGARARRRAGSPARRGARSALACLAALVCLAALAAGCTASVGGSGQLADPAGTSPNPSPTITDPSGSPSAAVPANLAPFYSQTLDWTGCGGTASCAQLEVPIDYDHPDAGTIQLAVKGYPPAGSSKGLGSLVMNPGGPGASGIDFVDSADQLLRGGRMGDVRRNYQLVGFDPRGVGQSAPLKCLDDAALDTLLAFNPTPTSPADIDQAKQLNIDQGQACTANSGPLAAHVTTVEAAKDMDVLRAALGETKLNYLGFSYGTFLGSTYAALFPANVGRMVLDGAVDPAQSAAQSGEGQAKGFQVAFDAWAADCLTRGKSCGLGNSVEELRAAVRSLLDRLGSAPLPTADPGRPLTESLGMNGVAMALYLKDAWPTLRAALQSAILDGDGTRLLALSDVYTDRNPDGTYATNSMQAFMAISCLDAVANPNKTDPPQSQYQADSPTFGDMFYDGGLDCATYWPATPSVNWPDYSAPGTPPIVVVGTSRDPATPYENSVNLARQLSSGVLLSRDGDGHTAYLGSSTCINDTVSAFLVDGTVPADGTNCGTR
ncbi:MAG: alpha/beta hydrolase, partial [Frankiaceae bacterium]|nr:alpha/beta hydrolase [Frankiaceae bacterium]